MRFRYILTLFVAFCVGNVWADVAIPPNSPQVAIVQAANGQSLDYRNVNLGNGSTAVWNGKNFEIPASKHFASTKASNGTITGTKTNPTTFTGQYGEKIKGSITTQTNVGSTSGMAKAGAAYIAGTSLSSGLNDYGYQIGANIKQGNYKFAAESAVAAVLSGLRNAGNAATFGFLGAGEQVAKGLFGNVESAAQAKAQAAATAAEMQQQQAAAAEQGINQATYAYHIRSYHRNQLVYEGYYPAYNSERYQVGATFRQGFILRSPEGTVLYTVTNDVETIVGGKVQVTDDIRNAMLATAASMSPNMPTIEDYMLNQAELSAIIAHYLERNLASNDALRTDIANMLWALGSGNGGYGADNTQTQVIGNPSDNTFLSAPYTPSGSNTAQQTQVIVHNNGDVTTTIIPRPDLGAHTSQAPTRSPVGKPKIDIDIDNDGSTTKPSEIEIDVEICDDDGGDDKVACLDAGSDDYTDLDLPINDIMLKFDHEDYFDTGGKCPNNPQFSFLGVTYTFSYAPLCKIIDAVSPIVELLGMATAAGIAYRAVKEL